MGMTVREYGGNFGETNPIHIELRSAESCANVTRHKSESLA